MLTEITPNLFLFNDTCNVYVVRNGSEAVLIDFGNGDVLSELSTVGIDHVTDVLMTHHHRDQGQGLSLAAEADIRIWVPQAEQDLFADIDAYWQARPIYNNYDVRQDRFSLLSSIPIAGTLADYETCVFGTHVFSIIPTPGHTVGSISILTEVDGRTVAFTGDLIAAPGKVWSLAATQWTYNGGEGISYSILSLLDVQERKPAYLLPSHGDPMDDPDYAIQTLVARMHELRLARRQNMELMEFREHPYRAILPHLLRNVTSISNSYVLLSQSGKALLIDFGYDFVVWPQPAETDRAARRPWLYTLPALKREFGVSKIDVVIPTHTHDDHVAGINLLQRIEGTQVWAAESFAHILEQPSAYNLPCLSYDPITVDRRLPLEQTFQWEEYTFSVHALPGHTRYAVAVAFEVDGERVLATGDQYEGGDGTKYNYVYENGFQIGDYRYSAELYARLNPTLIITGHSLPLHVQPGYFETLLERGEMLDRLHEELLPLNAFDLGGGDFVARIQPYQVMSKSGEPVSIEVIVRNPLAKAEVVQASLVVPSGWQIDPPEASATLEAHAEARFTFKVKSSARNFVRRARIAADVTVGKRHFGQHAEALITLK